MNRIAADERMTEPDYTAHLARLRSPVPPIASPTQSPAAGLFNMAVALCLFLIVATTAFATLFAARNPGVADLIAHPSTSRLHATGVILLDQLNENPRLLAAPPPDDHLPICAGVPERYRKPLHRAFGMMRGTAHGRELFGLLVTNDVCVAVADIPYNGGYATSWRATSGVWVHGTITLDDDYLRSRQADVLAAMLVHEATHIERAVNGESCDNRTDCEVLSNGVELDEEVAAHAAEALWWIAAYGEDGKRFAFGADYGENRLAAAFQDGPDTFRQYVRELRSDPKEGAGI
jgi:hypothetical protein